MTHTPTTRTLAVALAATVAIGGGTAAVAGAADQPSKPNAPTVQQRTEKREAAKTARQAAFAKELGVSVRDVQDARAAVRQAATEKRAAAEKARAEKQGVTVQQLRDQRADKVEKRLAKLVTKDRITQSQANAIVAGVRKGEPAKKQLEALREKKAEERRAARAEKRAERRAAEG